MQLCNQEALVLTAGLSTGALMAIIICVLILLSEYCTIQLNSKRFIVLFLFFTQDRTFYFACGLHTAH